MNIDMHTRTKVLKGHLKEWLNTAGNRQKRGEMNTYLATTLGLHMKSISRTMRRLQLKDATLPERRGRPKKYTKEVDVALYALWDAMGMPCAENMHGTDVIDEYIAALIKEKRWSFSTEADALLRTMSLGTMKRKVTSLREKYDPGRSRSTTTRSPLYDLIPIRKADTWTDAPPGHLQTDTVSHGGESARGDFVWSLGVVDYATYWTEYTAQWNKGKIATHESMKRLRTRFPVIWIELHPDSGGELITWLMYDWAHENGIAMTRSEPYRKNDNMCIEERNNNIARRHLGRVRLDQVDLVPVVQEILEIACVLHNHFRPVRRLLSKERKNGKPVKTYDRIAKTPYQRVLESATIPPAQKDALRALHDTLDPLELTRRLDTLKRTMWKLITSN